MPAVSRSLTRQIYRGRASLDSTVQELLTDSQEHLAGRRR